MVLGRVGTWVFAAAEFGGETGMPTGAMVGALVGFFFVDFFFLWYVLVAFGERVAFNEGAPVGSGVGYSSGFTFAARRLALRAAASAGPRRVAMRRLR